MKDNQVIHPSSSLDANDNKGQKTDTRQMGQVVQSKHGKTFTNSLCDLLADLLVKENRRRHILFVISDLSFGEFATGWTGADGEIGNKMVME